MPSVTITLTDTPTGGVAIKTDFEPAAGRPCSAAQAAALDIIRKTRRDSLYSIYDTQYKHTRLRIPLRLRDAGFRRGDTNGAIFHTSI